MAKFGATMGRILLVDDEPLVLEMFEEALTASGFDVIVSSGSRDALSQLDSCYFDAIVSDVSLDEIDGFDLLALARRRNPHIGALLMTGSPNRSDKERAISLGASYHAKPIGLQLLARELAGIVRTKDSVSA